MASKRFTDLEKELESARCPEDFFGNSAKKLPARIKQRRKELARILASRKRQQDKRMEAYEVADANDMLFRFNFLEQWAMEKGDPVANLILKTLPYGKRAEYRQKISFRVVKHKGKKFFLFEDVSSETFGYRIYLSCLSAYMFFDMGNYARYWKLNRFKITRKDGTVTEGGIDTTRDKYGPGVTHVHFDFGSKNQTLEASELEVGDTLDVFTVFHSSWQTFFLGSDSPHDYGYCLGLAADRQQIILDFWRGKRLVD